MTLDEKIVEAVARAIARNIEDERFWDAPGFQSAARAAISAYQAEASKKRIRGAHKITMAIRDIEEGNIAAVHFNGQTWRPVPAQQKDATFEIQQDGMTVALASGPRERAYAEAMHYAAVYGQDGPVEVFEHVPVPLPPAPKDSP